MDTTRFKLNQEQIEAIKKYINECFYPPHAIREDDKDSDVSKIIKIKRAPKGEKGSILTKSKGHFELSVPRIMAMTKIIVDKDDFVIAVNTSEDVELINLFNFSQEYYLQKEYEEATGSYKEIIGEQIQLIKSKSMKESVIIVKNAFPMVDLLNFSDLMKKHLDKDKKSINEDITVKIKEMWAPDIEDEQ